MIVIVLLISISLIIAIGFLISFLWNMKNGQYDDMHSPSIRMLFENKPRVTNNKKKSEKTDEL
jgi:cbb3-type cytochrome oxidase maturation protein